MIKVYLDNNCWDFLFFHQIDLAIELPAQQFEIWLVREVEMEIAPLETKNPELYQFIQAACAIRGIRTERIIGYDKPGTPDHERRYGFFGPNDRWATPDQLTYWSSVPIKANSKRPKTALHKDEADRALAARSIESIVVTSDASKSGPLKHARSKGQKILQLPDKGNLPQGWSLRSAILRIIEAWS